MRLLFERVDRVCTVLDEVVDFPVAFVVLTAGFVLAPVVVLELLCEAVVDLAFGCVLDAVFFDCVPEEAAAPMRTAELIRTVIKTRRFRFIPPSGDTKTTHSLASEAASHDNPILLYRLGMSQALGQT